MAKPVLIQVLAIIKCACLLTDAGPDFVEADLFIYFAAPRDQGDPDTGFNLFTTMPIRPGWVCEFPIQAGLLFAPATLGFRSLPRA